MFTNVVFQTADLKWLVPMIVGAVALLGCVAALFSNRSWSLAVVGALAVALIGASVFNKISVTKEGFIIETAQLSAQTLVKLEEAAKTNSDSINALTLRINELTAVTQKVAATQPASATNLIELNKITQDTQKIQNQIKQNDFVLKGIGKNNDLIKQSVGRLSTF